MQKNDFVYVLKLFEQLWPENKLEEKKLEKVFNDGLISDLSSYFCAIINKKIIGFGSLNINNTLREKVMSVILMS